MAINVVIIITSHIVLKYIKYLIKYVKRLLNFFVGAG